MISTLSRDPSSKRASYAPASFRPGARSVATACLFAGALALRPAEAQEPEERPHKRVLILHSLGRNFSPFVEFASGFQRELSRRAPTPVEFFEASLDSARFTDSNSEGPFVDYLSALFRDHPLDLVVSIGGAAGRFCLVHREALFSSTPLLTTGLERRVLNGAPPRARAASVSVVLDLPAQIENLLRVLPGTTDIVVVTGTAGLGKLWIEEAQREFLPFADRVRFTWFHELALQEMEKRVAALPPNTAIFYGGLTVDAAGVPHERDVALDILHAAANAPIFGLFDIEMGRGIVGGRLTPVAEASLRASEAALRILSGEKPESVLIEPVTMGAPVYDFRELERWGISEDRLPPGSTVLYRPPTAWDQYRGRILAVLAIISLQTALIAGLLVQRSRRRAAEEQGRDLTRRLLTAHEDERRRLARELHDDLSQRLARFAIDAGQMENRLQTVTGESAAPSIADGIAQLSEDVHSLSYQLHPSLIEDLGLSEALQAECERFSHTEGIPAMLESTDLEVELTPEASLCLFRVAQEALRNVSLHAGASQVSLSLVPVNGEVRLEVSDDGAGFDPANLRGRGSLGHASMRERVDLVRGRLRDPKQPRPRNHGRGLGAFEGGNRVSRPRVLLADDHWMVAEGLKNLLTPDFELVGVVEDGRALVEAARKLRPDVIVADITMPRLNGIEALVELKKDDPGVKLVFLTMHSHVAYARRALKAGAAGFVLKHSAPKDLVLAIRAALDGKTFIPPALAGEILDMRKDHRSRKDVTVLTPRQREVLQLLAEGKTAKEIGDVLGLSTRTVEFHKYEMMQTLAIQSSAELIHFAIKQGIVRI